MSNNNNTLDPLKSSAYGIVSRYARSLRNKCARDADEHIAIGPIACNSSGAITWTAHDHEEIIRIEDGRLYYYGTEIENTPEEFIKTLSDWTTRREIPPSVYKHICEDCREQIVRAETLRLLGAPVETK